MKTLLRKLLAPHQLRFDELYTVLVEVESILNSRPLAPLHTDEVVEESYLTPGHFLIGRPLKAAPSQDPGHGQHHQPPKVDPGQSSHQRPVEEMAELVSQLLCPPNQVAEPKQTYQCR